MRGRNKVYLLQLFLTTQSPSNLQTASPTATKVSFVPLWKWAKSFDLTTGGVLFRATETLGSTRFVPWGLCSTRLFLAALVAGGAFIELGTCLPEPASWRFQL